MEEFFQLLQQYNILGLLSGIGALGAFIVATFTYLNQKRTNKLQRFETTLFNMLSLQQQITNELIYEGYEPVKPPEPEKKLKENLVIKQGRDIFGFLWKEKWFYDRFANDGRITITDAKWYWGMSEALSAKGSKAYTQFREVAIFDHYFRHLYRIIKFIDGADCLTSDEKYKYTSIVRATLSSYELVWIFYNCLYGAGKPKFKQLVEEYAMLKNLRDGFLTISKDILDKENDSQCINWLDSDYKTHLTDKKNDSENYYLGAFFNKRDKIEFAKNIAEFKKNKK